MFRTASAVPDLCLRNGSHNWGLTYFCRISLDLLEEKLRGVEITTNGLRSTCKEHGWLPFPGKLSASA